MRLLPREEKFFHYFSEQADLIAQAAQQFRQAAERGTSALREAEVSIARLEQKGDEIIHEIYTRLNQTFITPLDPEDIHSLGSHMDDVLDGIEESVHRIVAYKIDPIPSTVIELGRIIEGCAATLQKAFQAMNAEKPLLEYSIEINRLEEQADHLVRAAISDLFDKETNPIMVIKLKEVYEYLELTTDYCEDVADALQNVIVKNG
jgi:predicted phosphate transport protein (TIGR00153 family)